MTEPPHPIEQHPTEKNPIGQPPVEPLPSEQRPAGQRRNRAPALRPSQVVPLLIVVIGVIGGMAVVAWGDWRIGCLIAGAFVGIGGVERLVLPKERAGLLQARSRFFDVIALLGMSIAIIVLAIVVPPSIWPH